MPRPTTIFILIALLISAWGCREPGPEMDVRLEVRLSSVELSAGGPQELTYRWTMAPGAEPVESDYQVFAHFQDAEGMVHWQDDHLPPVPTSRWQPGRTVEYTRILFAPQQAPPGDITMMVGLFDSNGSGEKVALANNRTDGPECEAARFTVLPNHRLPLIIHDRGWYDQEVGQGEADTWRWCRGEAVCWIESPGRPCSLYIDVRAPVKFLGAPQRAAFEVEGAELAVLELDSPDRVIHRIPIPEELVKDVDCFRLVVRTDKVVPPRETANPEDGRELGLKFMRLVVH